MVHQNKIIYMFHSVSASMMYRCICNWSSTMSMSVSACMVGLENHITGLKNHQPGHNKINKITCVQSDQSRVFIVCMKKSWVFSYPMSTQWRLIRLGGYQGWSKSSLGTRHFVGFVVLRLSYLRCPSNTTDNSSLYGPRHKKTCFMLYACQRLCCSLLR